MDYKTAGVSLDAAERAVKVISGLIPGNRDPRVLSSIGGFASLYDARDLGKCPALVATTDGVGTKAELAYAVGNYRGLGRDLVAMCVDDLICIGGKPLFFLDYIAVGENDPDLIGQLVASMIEALDEVQAALVGGEIAEHPGVMKPGQVDLAGFAVGVVEQGSILGPGSVKIGDVLIGLPSPNLRSNGFSLVRAIYSTNLSSQPRLSDGRELAEALLEPSVLYAPVVLPLVDAGLVRAACHVTGGGIPGNLPRILPDGTEAVVDRRSWVRPEIFDRIAADGDVTDQEMYRTFNCGIGMILACSKGDEEKILSEVPGSSVIGEIGTGSRKVVKWI
jgi:phosphoribosylformylglycinamidine cyclo-ligase